ncbi:MAG: MBG domain-containing protein, partial [Burkholderiales bacterium]
DHVPTSAALSQSGAVTIVGSTNASTASDYNFTFNNGTLTVTPRPVTLTVDNQGRAYGSANPSTGTATLTSGSFVFSDTVPSIGVTSPLLITDHVPTSAALSQSGAVTIVGSTNASTASDYNFTFNNGTLTVTPAPLTVTANNQTKTFGNTFTFMGTEFTPTGLKNSETINTVTLASMGAPAPAPVGPYPIIASAATGGTFTPTDYTITYAPGLMTVNPVTQPVPQQTSTNNLDELINPILVGMQSLGIGVPPGEGSLDCMVADNNFGVTVVDGVAVSLPHRCVPAIPD